MRIGICDDDALQRNLLKKKCKEICFENNISCEIVEFSSGKEILNYKGEHLILLFLDIELGDLDGIRVREQIEYSDLVWRIVFVSTHTERIFATFGLKTLDFGVKPINRRQVEKWIAIANKEHREDKLVKFEEHNKDTWIKESQIVFIGAEGNYITVHTNQEEFYITKSIKYWEMQLDNKKIIRVHRSYLVNLERIKKVNEMIEMDTGCTIAIGRKYRKDTLKAYNAFLQLKIGGRLS
jgi:DNA-binding LytR/AlgR family response regulator